MLQSDSKHVLFGNLLLSSKFPHVLSDVDEFRLPARLALRVTFNVIYSSAPA